MRWLVVLLLASLLSGCAGAPEEAAAPAAEPVQDADEAPPEQPEQNVSTLPTNIAPTALLNATSDGLNATFVVDVHDEDGDNLTWELDADGDGVGDANGTASQNVTFRYAAAGTYNATLRVSDGANETIANLTVVVEEAISYLPGQHAEGSFTAGGATLIGCFGDIFGVGYPKALDGVFYRSFALEPHTIGYSYTASVSAAAADSPGFAFLDADWNVVSSGFMSSHGQGEVPEGAAYGVWWSCLATPADGVFDSMPPA